MSKFPISRDEESPSQVILGPCPGCQMWTLQYDQSQVAKIFLNADSFRAYMEGVLAEHLTECSGLQEIVDNTP